MNIYSKTVPDLGTKVIGNAEECIALLDAHKPLPYDEVITYFIKMSRLGNSDIDKLSKISLQLYSNYLMKRHVIYPIKEDVINLSSKIGKWILKLICFISQHLISQNMSNVILVHFLVEYSLEDILKETLILQTKV